MLKRFRRRLGKGEEGAGAAEDGREETVGDPVKGRNGGQEDLGGVEEQGPEQTESQEDDEEATGAIDADGLRAARARLSLDDGTIRSQPKDEATVTRKPTKEELNEPEKAVPEPNLISEGPSDSAEGRVARKSNLELPVLLGTSGLAGWEPLQGPYRRRSVEIRKENQVGRRGITRRSLSVYPLEVVRPSWTTLASITELCRYLLYFSHQSLF